MVKTKLKDGLPPVGTEIVCTRVKSLFDQFPDIPNGTMVNYNIHGNEKGNYSGKYVVTNQLLIKDHIFACGNEGVITILEYPPEAYNELVVNKALALVRNLFKEAEASGNQVLTDVWCIVTALRGPDDNACGLKGKYTVPIRARVLTDRQSYAVGADSGSEDRYNQKFADIDIPSKPDQCSHFIFHALLAIDAIERKD